MSVVLSGAGDCVQMALWSQVRPGVTPALVSYWAVPCLSPPSTEPDPATGAQGSKALGQRGGAGDLPSWLPPADPPFPWPSGGSSTRSPTTAAACTWWRGATSAASPTGRPTAHACSRSAGCSTSSSPTWGRAAYGGNKDPKSPVLAGLGVLSGSLPGGGPWKPGGARKPTLGAPKA